MSKAKPSKELRKMREEEVTAEPSLDGLMPDLDLTDPRVKSFFAKLLREEKAQPSTEPSQGFDPAELRRALAEETGLSEDDLRQLAPGLLD